jgi:hypothetical protein
LANKVVYAEAGRIGQASKVGCPDCAQRLTRRRDGVHRVKRISGALYAASFFPIVERLD